MRHPNVLDSVFSYDGGNRMTKIELKDASTVKESLAYALDKTGNIITDARYAPLFIRVATFRVTV